VLVPEGGPLAQSATRAGATPGPQTAATLCWGLAHDTAFDL
jgi:hypothetical protein